MKRLWAPWRLKYILGIKESKCIFCEALKKGDDKKVYILSRGKKTFVILNTFPYNNGHLMIATYRHCADFQSLSSDELLEMGEMIKRFTAIIQKVMSPDGFNIGVNLGKSAGAGVADHLHVHIVPRWEGDTNFMPIVGKTKVIPESLDSTYAKFKQAMGKE